MNWRAIDFWWCVSLLPCVITFTVLSFIPFEAGPVVLSIMVCLSFYLGYAVFNDGTSKYRRDVDEEPLVAEPAEERLDSSDRGD
jgi:hypothetical protein